MMAYIWIQCFSSMIRSCRHLSWRSNGRGLLQLQQLLPRSGGLQQLLVSFLSCQHEAVLFVIFSSPAAMETSTLSRGRSPLSSWLSRRTEASSHLWTESSLEARAWPCLWPSLSSLWTLWWVTIHQMWWWHGDVEFLPSADLCRLPLVPGHIRGWGWQQTKLEDGWLVSVLEEKIQEAETSEVSARGPGALQGGDGGQPGVQPHVSSHLVSGKVISSQLISQWPPCHVRTVWRWPGARCPSSLSPPASPPWPPWSDHLCHQRLSPGMRLRDWGLKRML